MPKLEKYLLCIPRGHLAAVLSQIEICRRYAREYKRILVIDTRASFLADDFSNYFKAKEDESRVILSLNDPLKQHLNGLSIFPKSQQGRIGETEPCYDEFRACYIDRTTGEFLGFNLHQDYEEECLVYSQGQDYDCYLEALYWLELAKPSQANVQSVCQAIGRKTCMVFVDMLLYKNDNEAFLRATSLTLAGHAIVLIAENAANLQIAAPYFKKSKILLQSSLPVITRRGSGCILARNQAMIEMIFIAAWGNYLFEPPRSLSERHPYLDLIIALNKRRDLVASSACLFAG